MRGQLSAEFDFALLGISKEWVNIGKQWWSVTMEFGYRPRLWTWTHLCKKRQPHMHLVITWFLTDSIAVQCSLFQMSVMVSWKNMKGTTSKSLANKMQGRQLFTTTDKHDYVMDFTDNCCSFRTYTQHAHPNSISLWAFKDCVTPHVYMTGNNASHVLVPSVREGIPFCNMVM